jgi:hypothetical protein
VVLAHPCCCRCRAQLYICWDVCRKQSSRRGQVCGWVQLSGKWWPGHVNFVRVQAGAVNADGPAVGFRVFAVCTLCARV